MDSRGQVHVLYRAQLTLYYVSRQDETWGDLFEAAVFRATTNSGFPDRDMAVDAGGNLHVVWSGPEWNSIPAPLIGRRLEPAEPVGARERGGVVSGRIQERWILIYSCEGAYNTPDCAENAHQYRKMPPGGNWGSAKYLGSFDDTPELDLHYDPTGDLVYTLE